MMNRCHCNCRCCSAINLVQTLLLVLVLASASASATVQASFVPCHHFQPRQKLYKHQQQYPQSVSLSLSSTCNMMTPLRRRTSLTNNANDNLLNLSVWTKGKVINNNNCIMIPVQTTSTTSTTTSTSIGATANNHHEQKSILTLNYKLLAMVYLMDSFILLSMPNRITPLLPFHYRYRTSLVGGSLGHAIASVVSFVLLLSSDEYGSINNSDIESNSESKTKNITDTPTTAINTAINTANTNYDILNLGLFLFSILGIPVIPGEAALCPTFQGSFLLFLWILITKCLGVVVTLSHFSRCSFIRSGVGGSVGVSDGSNSSKIIKAFRQCISDAYNSVFKNKNTTSSNISTGTTTNTDDEEVYDGNNSDNDDKKITSMNDSISGGSSSSSSDKRGRRRSSKDATKMYQSLFFVILFCLGNHVMSLFNPYSTTRTIPSTSLSVISSVAPSSISSPVALPLQLPLLPSQSPAIPLQLLQSLHLSAIARLSLISTIVIVLKNAAVTTTTMTKLTTMTATTTTTTTTKQASIEDQKLLTMLDETPYILLNLSLGCWAFIVGITEGIIDNSFVIRKSLNMMMLSWLFLYKGFTSIQRRRIRRRITE